MSYSEKANGALIDVIEKARRDAENSQGKYLCFEIQGANRRKVDENDLVAYCNVWYKVERDKFDEGWRPEIGKKTESGRGWLPDRTGIFLLSSHNTGPWAVKVQGRVESVRAMAVLGAGYALGISPNAAMVCPAASEWWDWLEDLNLVRERPPATHIKKQPDEKGKRAKYRSYTQDSTAKTSVAVKQYRQVMWTDKCRQHVEAARKDIEACPPPWKRLEGTAAQQKYEKMFEQVQRTYQGGDYIRAELDFGLNITTGNLIWYCQQVWPDCVLDKLGTRWRPRTSTVGWKSKQKDSRYPGDKGGVYLPDDTHKAVACIGTPAMCRAVMPILAALAAGIPDAKMVAQNAPQFDIFWEYVGWNKNMPPPEAPTEKPSGCGAWRRSRAYDQDNIDDDDFMARLFKRENDAMLELQWYNVGEYNRTNGQWCGGECIPGVSWSRDDFVDNLMLWWGDAVVEEVGRFRYRASFMDKGGLVLDIGGAYTSLQSKEAWAQAMMCMLGSIMAGIPAEIAALIPASDPFWDFICDKEGPEVVRIQRSKIRSARDARFGPEWQTERHRRESKGNSEKKFQPRVSGGASSSHQRDDTPSHTEETKYEAKPAKQHSSADAGGGKSPEKKPIKKPELPSSQAPVVDNYNEMWETSGTVTAALKYIHENLEYASMERGERFYCKYETPMMYYGLKEEGGEEGQWLPKYVVTWAQRENRSRGG
ncbi:hypothetical protein FOL46_007950 [Perkinsus olseni]|nr:hypothetical protein FOL46_007950 [Perkinsus olseni]